MSLEQDREEHSASASPDDLNLDPIKWLNRLIHNGKQVEATSTAVDISRLPDYFDRQRFKQAQATCQRYYMNMSLASSTGLMLLLQVESILHPLLRTGKSRTVVDLYDRYTATGKYILACYDSDFFEPDSSGWKYISLVRAMHQRIHRLMNDGLHPISSRNHQHSGDGSGKNTSAELKVKDEMKSETLDLWVNQYDMALTQFAFIGLFLLNPSKCGAYRVTRNQLADVTYYWRIISYYFGIEEQFNLFVNHDDIDRQLEILEVVRQHFSKDLLSLPRNPVGVRMAEGFMLAFEDLSTESSFNILDHWWSPYISLSGREKLAPYTMIDRCKLVLFHFYVSVLFRLEFAATILNKFYKRKFEKFCADADKIKLKLDEKYKHITNE